MAVPTGLEIENDRGLSLPQNQQTKASISARQTLIVVAVFSLARIWRECSTIHSPPALLILSLLFVFEVEISSRTLIPLFMPGPVHSGSAS